MLAVLAVGELQPSALDRTVVHFLQRHKIAVVNTLVSVVVDPVVANDEGPSPLI